MQIANIDRVKKLAILANFPEDSTAEYALSRRGLHEGRDVLLTKCVVCHDLRTILAKPRTPTGWVQTVERMVAKPVLGEPLTQEDQWTVSAYLIAVTPDIQSSAKVRRRRELELKQTREALAVAANVVRPALGRAYDTASAKELFESLCTQCHELDEVDGAPPQTEADIQPLIPKDGGKRSGDRKAGDQHHHTVSQRAISVRIGWRNGIDDPEEIH